MPGKVQNVRRDYINQSTQQVNEFMLELRNNVASENGTFDSAAASDFVSAQLNESGTSMPEKLRILLDSIPKEKQFYIQKALFDSADTYEAEHGIAMPADLAELAIHNAWVTSPEGRKVCYDNGITLDDASNNSHSANLSLQPNRAVVAILAATNDPVPFALYLPTDIGSNEARTAILTHQPGATAGMYPSTSLLDGVSAGKTLLCSSRSHTANIISGSSTAATLTTNQQVQASTTTSAFILPLSNLQANYDRCLPPGSTLLDGVTAALTIPVLKGRTIVYVNGQVWGMDSATNSAPYGSGTSSFTASGSIAGTAYSLSVSVNIATGAVTITAGTALPVGAQITVEAFIDYEVNSAFIPSIQSNAQVYQLYATPWQTFTTYTPGAITQMNQELGLDPYSESLLAIQNQFTAERHYQVLSKGLRLAQSNTATYDFAWNTTILQGSQKTRAMIVQDMQGQLGALSQQMANNTYAYGISHLYVDATMASIFQSLPSEMWESSGVQVRPGIYRVGRLFGQYEVYFTPNILSYNAGTSQILCFGRAPDVTRNPFILGDAVPPMVLPVPANTAAVRGAAFYGRNFTSVNPHQPSSQGVALLNVTNVGL